MRRRFTSAQGIEETFDCNNYLTMEALENGFSITFSNEVEYGIDGVGWKKLKIGDSTPAIDMGRTISFRGNLTPQSTNGVGKFIITRSCNLLGNVMSILFGNRANSIDSLDGYAHAFRGLFYNCSGIRNISDGFLPATTLAEYCYYSMFDGCTSLVKAPELPATTLAEYCYYSMFDGCTSLVKAPELPATTLAEYCYYSMFDGCTSLVKAPELPATTLAETCYGFMFYACTSLVKAPELPATTLANYCYDYMFHNCYNLNYIKMLATDISATDCLYSWVYGVSPTGTFVKSKDATWDVTGSSGVPEGWTVITDDQESGGEITFYLSDEVDAPYEMKAESGMTWEQWVNSNFAPTEGVLRDFGLFNMGSYDTIILYHELAGVELFVYKTYGTTSVLVQNTEQIENGKTYYIY